jgi:hypothetical protein
MDRRIVIALGGLALASGVLALMLTQAAHPTPGSPARENRDSGAGVSRPQSANRDQPALKTERDAAAVFQRAFWRRPGPDVRILEGERREWIDGKSAVQKWQWFVALQTTPEFRRWLLEENPFELARTDAAPADMAPTEPAPKWFPAATARAEMTAYRARGSGFTIFLNAKSGRLFATDAGSGFAAAVR